MLSSHSERGLWVPPAVQKHACLGRLEALTCPCVCPVMERMICLAPGVCWSSSRPKWHCYGKKSGEKMNVWMNKVVKKLLNLNFWAAFVSLIVFLNRVYGENIQLNPPFRKVTVVSCCILGQKRDSRFPQTHPSRAVFTTQLNANSESGSCHRRWSYSDIIECIVTIEGFKGLFCHVWPYTTQRECPLWGERLDSLTRCVCV